MHLLNRTACTVILGATTMAFPHGVAAGGTPPRSKAGAHRSKLEAKLQESIDDPSTYRCLRVDVRGDLGDGAYSLRVYGHGGFGIWNGERQFKLSTDEVRGCLEALERYGFVFMPEEIGEPAAETPGAAASRGTGPAIRAVTLVVAGMRRTVTSQGPSPETEDFSRMGTAIAAICHRAASRGFVTADSLEDGLEKVATGVLSPDVLEVTLNAPELKSLKSQEGQGWKVIVSKGRLTAMRWTLRNGPGAPVQRWLSDGEIRSLARTLAAHHAASLPATLNLPGYTQLSVTVLDHRRSIMARRSGGPRGRDPGEKNDFLEIRKTLFGLFEDAFATYR